MFKIFKRITKTTDAEGNTKVRVQEPTLSDSRKVILSLIFSLAAILKVTPKALATEFSKTRAREFGLKVNAELDKINEKALAKLRDSINAPAKTAKRKPAKKAK